MFQGVVCFLCSCLDSFSFAWASVVISLFLGLCLWVWILVFAFLLSCAKMLTVYVLQVHLYSSPEGAMRLFPCLITCGYFHLSFSIFLLGIMSFLIRKVLDRWNVGWCHSFLVNFSEDTVWGMIDYWTCQFSSHWIEYLICQSPSVPWEASSRHLLWSNHISH